MLTDLLAEGRRAAESRMTSRVTIYRADPASPTTDDRGLEVAGYATILSDVPFRLAATRGSGRSRTVRRGDSEVEVAVREGHMPTWVADLRDRDVLRVTSGESAGRFFEVVDATPADQQTARRPEVVEIDKPGGIA